MAQVVGHFDGVEGSLAIGWIVQPDAPERVLTVEFFANAPAIGKTKLGRARANRPRPDLIDIGISETHHGFEWHIPFLSREFLLTARVMELGIEIPGGPIRISPNPVYEGTLESVEQGVVRGWAWAWDPAISVEVDIFVDYKLRATVPARLRRPDLVLARMGNGHHGFAWTIPHELVDKLPHDFGCRIAGTSTWLAGTPRKAVVRPGIPSVGMVAENVVRGYAERPLPRKGAPSARVASTYQESSWVNTKKAISSRLSMEGPTNDATSTAASESWRPLNVAVPPQFGGAPSNTVATRRVRLLIAVWGSDYIATFCRTSLPSLLAPNNLPYLVARYPVEVVFLTRLDDRGLFKKYPSYQRLSRLIPVVFTDINDILARYFDPNPDAYATALTYAFYRGIQSMGAAACDTDFLFWNSDFIAADGVFRTLADLIAAGVRCTLAPSLRVDSAIESELVRRTNEDDVLNLGPREWAALASRFRHPTVMAQMVNRFEERMVDTTNKLYWHISDTLMVGRVFLMFMLHIRPERVWDDVYGHCDYTFLPELVPSGNYHFETHSDRLLIIELQGQNRDSADIILGDHAITPMEAASGVSRWSTREHRLASRQLVVVNAEEIEIDLESVRQMTDKYMDIMYERLLDPIWHNGHFHWTHSLSALGIACSCPGPDHPRSHLAAALRWTGYDIDVLRESWPDPAGAPDDIFGMALPINSNLDVSTWLATTHVRYYNAWLDFIRTPSIDLSEVDLLSGHFHGVGWGLVTHTTSGWARQLGPDGWAALLVTVAYPCSVQISLHVVDHPRIRPEALSVCVNGCICQPVFRGSQAGQTILHYEIDHDIIMLAQGGLRILFGTPTGTNTEREPNAGSLALSEVTLQAVVPTHA